MTAAKTGETVLVLGATGNIGVSAVIAALRSGYNVLAAARNQASAKKLLGHLSKGHDRITITEADLTSSTGVQGIVEKVRAGSLPAFQHVWTSIGGIYSFQSLLDITNEQLREAMSMNFEGNFYAYRATLPYLLEQKNPDSTFTVCTGSQGDDGTAALPAMTQGALFSMCYAACKQTRDTNVRFNEVYLGFRVEVDSSAEKTGAMKASKFAQLYEQVLQQQTVKSCRVRVDTEADVESLRYEQK